MDRQLELDVSRWIGNRSLELDQVRGKVVLVEAFQMLCPGCVSHAIPQAQRIHRTFDSEQVAVIGLHTVFEHHDVMGPDALAAFVHEYRITFPVAIDRHEEGERLPMTMRRYGLQGTPSTILADRTGRIRRIEFGQVQDLAIGAWIGQLLSESAS